MGKDITDRIAREENEADKKAVKKVLKTAGKALITPIAIPAGTLVGGAVGATVPESTESPRPIGAVEGAKLGAKAAYHSLWGTDEDVKKDFEDARAAVKRNKSIERKKDTGDAANPMGDNYRKGGKVIKTAYKSGGKVRGCGIAQKGLTKGRMV